METHTRTEGPRVVTARAAWLDATFVLGAFIVVRAVVQRAGLLPSIDDTSSRFALLAHVALNAVIACALVFGALALRKASLRDIGAGPTRIGPTIGWGLLGAIAAYALQIPVVIALTLLSHGRVEHMAQQRSEVLGNFTRQPAVLIPVVALLAGFYEELLVRGFTLARLRTAYGSFAKTARTRDVLAVIVSSLAFGLAHAYQGWVGVVQTFVAGLVLATLTVWRGSIWPAVVAHTTIDSVSLFIAQILLPMVRETLAKRGQL